MKYWIYDDNNKFRRVDESRLDFNFPHTPKGSVFYKKRVNRTTNKVLDWCYFYMGKTKQECWDAATKHARLKLEKIKQEYDRCLADFKDCYGERPEE
jgi:hypothetical protein